MPNIIKPEQKQKAIRLYRNKNLTAKEIAILTNMSESEVYVVLRQAFDLGIVKPREPEKSGKNGVQTKKGNPNLVRKYTNEDMEQIALDYYKNGLSTSALRAKWGIHPVQLQTIRNKFSSIYGSKQKPTRRPVQQFDREGNLIAEYDSGYQASLATAIPYKNINNCCNGRCVTSNGFVWRFKTSPNLNVNG